MINLEKLEDPEKALYYFTVGKRLFEDNLMRRYGPSFKLIMNGPDVPEIYFQIFEGRARTNIKLNQFRDAISDCDWAINLRPTAAEPYRLRAIAKFSHPDHAGACNDLINARRLGAKDTATLVRKFCQ
jgi:hypothetical protein